MSDNLGLWLRRSREARRLELDDAVKALRIRKQYLRALELGDYEALPGPIQARGFLRNYARFLDLPVEEVLARYDAEVQGVPVQPRAVEMQLPSPGQLRTWAPPPPSLDEERVEVRARASGSLLRIFLILLAFFALLVLVSFAWLRWGAEADTQASSTTVVSAAVEITATAPSATATAKPVFPVSADGTVRIRLIPESHAWISVSADDVVVFQGIAVPLQVIEAVGKEMVVISTGNGAAFRLFVNGTDWGTLGGQGEVVQRAWTPSGEVAVEDL